jgi:hypothetical protein
MRSLDGGTLYAKQGGHEKQKRPSISALSSYFYLPPNLGLLTVCSAMLDLFLNSKDFLV